MGKKPGGATTERAITNDVYFSLEGAEWLVKWLVKNKLFHRSKQKTYPYLMGLDACAGKDPKPLSEALCTYGYLIDTVEINENRPIPSAHCYKADILEWQPDCQYDFIICNPPWSPVDYAEKIYYHLLTLLAPKGTLYFIINYAFVNTNWQRGGLLGNGLTIFLPRYTFAKSQLENNPESSALLDPILMINRQLKTDPPFFAPIPPEICKTDQKLMGFL